MYQIKTVFGQIIGGQIVPTNLQVPFVERLEEARIHVSRHHPARWSDLSTEPLGDGTSTRTDFKALPSLADAQCIHAPESCRVKTLFEQPQALACLLPRIIEDIGAHTRFLPFSGNQSKNSIQCQPPWRTARPAPNYDCT